MVKHALAALLLTSSAHAATFHYNVDGAFLSPAAPLTGTVFIENGALVSLDLIAINENLGHFNRPELSTLINNDTSWTLYTSLIGGTYGMNLRFAAADGMLTDGFLTLWIQGTNTTTVNYTNLVGTIVNPLPPAFLLFATGLGLLFWRAKCNSH